MGILTAAAIVVYLGIGLVQFLAIVAGVQAWWGIHWIISGMIALFLAYLPVIGTITGIMGAVRAWGWSFTASILFFCWPFALYILIAIFAGFSTFTLIVVSNGVSIHMIGIKNSILKIVLLFASIGSTASGAEFTDHQYNYVFQYPADWKMKPPPAKEKDDLGEVRVFIQGPRAALTVTIGHIGKSVSESQFLRNPDSERIVKMLIDLSIDRYKQMSKTINANRMTVLENRVVPSTKGIRFYISTIHFLDGKPPVAMVATHMHPFDKPYGIIFLMSILADKKVKQDQNLYDDIFNSFHLLGELPATK